MLGKPIVKYCVDEANAGLRLDRALAGLIPTLSRARAQKLISENRLSRTDQSGRRRPVTKGAVVQRGDILEFDEGVLEQPRATADSALQLEVVLLNDDLVVIDKEAGMPSAPKNGQELGCVANGLVAAYPEMAGVGYGLLEPGLCHRLDNGTSGLLMAARHPDAFEELTQAIRSGRMDKRYELVCADGPALEDEGEIRWSLAPHASDSRKMVSCGSAGNAPIRGQARAALTRYKVLERHHGRALVEASAASAGRHQLRSHFSGLGCPLLGDVLYGGEPREDLIGHALHATRIVWTGGEVAAFDIESPSPFKLLASCGVCDRPTFT